MSSVNQYIQNYDSLVEKFCWIDDFCKDFVLQYQSHLLSSGIQKRIRASGLSYSEIMTIVIEFHSSRYTDFKAFYLQYVIPHLKNLFPNLVSYNRFIELLPRILIPMIWCSQSMLPPCTGISFVDSTPLKVCHNKRIFNHKVFKNIAQRGKSSMGWFFGFKLHIVVSENGDLLSHCLTSGNVDDKNPLGFLSKNLSGKLFADKGYISKNWFQKLYNRSLNKVKLITGIKRNMKNKLMDFMEKIYLRKRSIIETINDWLKNVCHIEHSRHRSPTNFLVNLFSGLIAYQLSPKKPKIKFTHSQLSLIPSVL